MEGSGLLAQCKSVRRQKGAFASVDFQTDSDRGNEVPLGAYAAHLA